MQLCYMQQPQTGSKLKCPSTGRPPNNWWQIHSYRELLHSKKKKNLEKLMFYEYSDEPWRCNAEWKCRKFPLSAFLFLWFQLPMVNHRLSISWKIPEITSFKSCIILRNLVSFAPTYLEQESSLCPVHPCCRCFLCVSHLVTTWLLDWAAVQYCQAYFLIALKYSIK
jgi:hypothetical protein